MALDITRLADSIKSQIQTAAGGTPSDDPELMAFCTALSTAIIGEITGHAVVTATGPDPQGGTQNVTGTVS